MRVLVASHHHPDIVAGGAERAAYSLFQRLRSDPRIECTAFLASTPSDHIGHSAHFGSFRSKPDEILVSLPPIDGFTLETKDFNELDRRILDIVRHFKPDIVHLHHVLEWGIEAIEIFARANVRVVLTLHEFILICHQNGQMLKTTGELCYAASPAECGRCFPAFSPGKFFVRASLIQHLMGQASKLISPSHFLKARFVEWGVPGERIAVIENLLNVAFEQPVNARAPSSQRNRRRTVFAFFGQITPFKGADVLLRAYGLLSDSVRREIEVRIYGENKYWRGGEFQQRTDTLIGETKGGVRMLGAYRNDDVIRLMRECDFVVVPSLWWENSPVVIQEAKLAGARIICSDIGGMSEKTEAGVDFRFPAGNAAALAALIEDIATSRYRPNAEATGDDRTANVAAAQARALEAHISVYASVLHGSRSPQDRAPTGRELEVVAAAMNRRPARVRRRS